MTEETTPIGSINVSPQAIATISYRAAMESYGVVGLTSKNLAHSVSNMITKDPTHGVEVQYDGQKINIDLYIVVEYGTRIKSVANSVANTVRYHVEKAIGMPVNEVNIHIQGLRISSLD
jgi:uncharacterized alkaline shock family protein YloU